ncbi:hypothetical protein DIPPA_09550 [Diplonema papillatum]|nr:hypothetical protein DIPPA_09550 [Diplonema papillatum]
MPIPFHYTTSTERKIVKLDLRASAMETMSGEEGMTAIDYDTFHEGHKTLGKKPPRTMSDKQMLAALREVLYRKHKDVRAAFCKMLRYSGEQQQGNHQKPEAPRVPIREFLDHLKLLGCALEEDEVAAYLAQFEAYPGEGLDYADFTDIMGDHSSDMVSTRRETHDLDLTTVKLKPMSRSMASNVLPRVASALPQGTYGEYDRTTVLYGTASGLDINTDNSNNGFYCERR